MRYIKKFEDYVASFKSNKINHNDEDTKDDKIAEVSTNDKGFVIECDGDTIAIESGLDEGNEEVPAEEITKALEKLNVKKVSFENEDGEKETHEVNEFLKHLNPLRWKLSKRHRSIYGHVKSDE